MKEYFHSGSISQHTHFLKMSISLDQVGWLVGSFIHSFSEAVVEGGKHRLWNQKILGFKSQLLHYSHIVLRLLIISSLY